MKIGFDNEKYILLQSENIRKRVSASGGKLYLEFGGKLFDDYHASRVLPGFEPDSKIKMLSQMKNEVEILIAINANDIEKNKVRGDIGITYDMEVLRLIDEFRERGFLIRSVVLTQYRGQHLADKFIERLEILGLKVYKHHMIAGYPSDIHHIVSDNGYGKNEYIDTEKPIIVVTGPGPGSGKMAVCLSQLFHEHKNNKKAGYAKYETFPIWNLPLKHPVNIAYETATADLNDINMIDPFHLEAYKETATNYNRDVEIFPVLNAILEHIFGVSPYRSPTDMGVNMAGNCIIDDDAVKNASNQEIIRRYFTSKCRFKEGLGPEDSVFKMEILMKQAGVTVETRKIATFVRQLSEETGRHVAGIQLADGTIITGKESTLMCAPAAMLMNALKALAKIDDSMLLLSPSVIGPVQELKTKYLGNASTSLHMDEMLVTLSVCANTSPLADVAFRKLPKLKGCEVHSSVILESVDEKIFRRLGVNVTCEAQYPSNKLYME